MTYNDMNEMLQKEFNKAPSNLPRHSKTICLCDSINLTLTYPGYKTTHDKMDFKITLKGHAVSHEDFIRDIWIKLESGVKPDVLRNFLFDLAENGIALDKKDYSSIDGCSGYSLDELLHTIAWIALQEDINYPMPRYQGRKMPFYRYIEAIYVYTDPENPHKLNRQTVLDRTNVKGKPPLPINIIDYGVIHNIK